MRTIQLLVLLLLVSSMSCAAEKDIKLSKPDMERKATVMKSLAERKSTREFAAKDLSLADLSDLLWAANGINRPDKDLRTAPSAMNRQEVDVYVLMKEGAYLYDAKAHQLNWVAEGDFRSAAAGRQEFAKDAPISIVLVADLSKLGDPKSAGTMTTGAIDVGIVSQNISIFCAAANLATVPRGTMERDQLVTALKLKESQVPLLNHPVGYFK